MLEERPVAFDLSRLDEIKARIPSADFVRPEYDSSSVMEPTQVLVLLSTPRSGSTLLCELLRLNAVCLPHEYFHPGQYMPLLAERWQCLRGAVLDEPAYVASLRRYRTYPNGWLGINVHGSHLRYFIRMARFLSDAAPHFVHLVRRNVIAQAVSYHVASQTRQWRNEFVAAVPAEYSYAGILTRLERIQAQNALIQAFLVSHRVEAITVYYEDLVACTEQTLRRIPGVPANRQLTTQPTIRKQSGARSAQWAQRFAEEFVINGTLDGPRQADRGLQRLVRLLRRVGSGGRGGNG